MAEVHDDQLATLRRLRAAFGFVEVVEVISHDPAAAPDTSTQGASMADRGGCPLRSKSKPTRCSRGR